MQDKNINPYETPESDVFQPQESGEEFQYIGPQKRSAGNATDWIGQGFKLFTQSPGGWILTMIVGFILMIVIGMIPIIGSLFSMITTYIWVAGMLLGCHAVFKGAEMDVKFLFAGFTNQPGRLVLLSLLGLLVTMIVAIALMSGSFSEFMITGEGDVESNIDPLEMTLKMLIGFACLIPLMMASWFAPALIVLQDMGIVAAMKASFSACSKNFLPFLLYGVLMFVIMIVCVMPFGLGLLVFMPLLYGSIYMSYRDVFLQKI
jgi:hypothetical protein